MCHISIVKRIDSGPIDQDLLLATLGNEMSSNSDGGWVRAMQPGDTFEIKSMSGKKLRRFLRQHTSKETPFSWLMSHFRWATSGRKSSDNIHGYQARGWVFAHNGTVPMLSDGHSAEKTDSLNFFEKMVPLLPGDHTDARGVVAAIEKMHESYNIYGRFMLYSENTDCLWLSGTWWVYHIGNLLWISSAALDFGDQKNKKEGVVDIAGIELLAPKVTVSEGSLFGIGAISGFSQPDFRYSYLKALPQYSYVPTYSQSVTLDQDEERQLELERDFTADKEEKPEFGFRVGNKIAIGGVEYLNCGKNGEGHTLLWSLKDGLHDMFRSCCAQDACAENWDFIDDGMMEAILAQQYDPEMADRRYLLEGA